MIRLNKLNKYYNKGNANEIHAINNTCLEFGNTGLVCILGESGSGKTTLLNIIGGLDSFHNGSITIDDTTLIKSSYKEIEKIRNLKFGYIFQEKYLLQDYTVDYNIRLALNMYDLSEEEKEIRIDYVLKSVGMQKYKKRLVSQLSGGQQQRIAIARALVKSPDVIFADEPTGNLDEANTLRIMSIIKQISKECLVILVTHEKQMADFFADRTIYIRDGRVVEDVTRGEQQQYQYNDDTNLYLKEYKKETYLINNLKINLFNIDQKNELELNVIYKNDKFYIQASEKAKVELLNSENEIHVVDDYKPVLNLEQVEEFDYFLPHLEVNKRSELHIRDAYQLAKRNLKTLGKRMIFMIVSFIITAFLLVIAVVDYMTAAAIDKKSVITEDSNYINVNAFQNSSVDNQKYYDSFSMIYSTILRDKVAEDRYIDLNEKLSFTDNSYKQITEIHYTMDNFSYVTLEHFNAKDLILGRMPEKRNEVIIDKWLIEKFYESNSILKTLLPKVEDFLGLELCSSGPVLTITGICDIDEPTLFVDKYMGISIGAPNDTVASLDQLCDAYPGEYDDVKLSKDEILVSEAYYAKKYADVNPQILINGSMYTVVGTYPDKFDTSYVIDAAYYEDTLNKTIINDRRFMIYSKEKEPILKYFAQNLGNFDKTYVNLKVIDIYHEQLAAFEKSRAIKLNARLIATVTIFGVSIFMLFFTMKSNILKRAQEISVYRLMGITKRSVLSIFIFEVIFITNSSELPVVVVLSSVFKIIASIPSLQIHITYPWHSIAVLLLFCYAVNIFIGILSVNSIIKLPPARIAEKA